MCESLFRLSLFYAYMTIVVNIVLYIALMKYVNIFYPNESGFMKVYDGDHWGLYDSEGTEVFPIIYDDIYYDKGLKVVFIQNDASSNW